jgi:hypothetical protein
MSYTLGMVTKELYLWWKSILLVTPSRDLVSECEFHIKPAALRVEISYYITVFELKYLAQPSDAITGLKIYGTVAPLSILLSEIRPPKNSHKRARHRTNKLRARKLQVLVRVSAIESGSDETKCLTNPRLSPQSVSERDT